MNALIIHEVEQGSKEWLELREQFPKSASLAPAMMGVSPYVTRTDLLNGFKKDISSFLQGIFDEGHRAEELARDMLENDLGIALYPDVGTRGVYLASLDGRTLSGDLFIFECKQWNKDLTNIILTGKIPLHIKWQLIHQQYVFEYENTKLVVTDGTEENWVEIEFSATEDDFKQLLAGWALFDKDLENHIPEQKLALLPVEKYEEAVFTELYINISGDLAADSNASIALSEINKKLKEDKNNFCNKGGELECNFSNYKSFLKSVGQLKKFENNIKVEVDRAIQKMGPLSKEINTLNKCKELSTPHRLLLNKAADGYKADFNARETLAVTTELKAYKEGFKDILFSELNEDFKGVLKGKSSLDNKKEALANELVRCKLIIDEQVNNYNLNNEYMKGENLSISNPENIPLVNGFLTLPADDFKEKISVIVEKERKKREEEKTEERNVKISHISAFPSQTLQGLNPDGIKAWLDYFESYDYEKEDLGELTPQAVVAVNAAIKSIREKMDNDRELEKAHEARVAEITAFQKEGSEAGDIKQIQKLALGLRKFENSEERVLSSSVIAFLNAKILSLESAIITEIVSPCVNTNRIELFDDAIGELNALELIQANTFRSENLAYINLLKTTELKEIEESKVIPDLPDDYPQTPQGEYLHNQTGKEAKTIPEFDDSLQTPAGEVYDNQPMDGGIIATIQDEDGEIIKHFQDEELEVTLTRAKINTLIEALKYFPSKNSGGLVIELESFL